MKVLLIFPPGWNINVGSPHLGLPLLKAALKDSSSEVFIKDLNWEIGEYLKLKPSINEVYSAVNAGDLESLNKPYFKAEDKLMGIAEKYNATWNVEFGYKYNNYTPDSSSDVLDAVNIPSLFIKYYEKKVIPYIENIDPKVIGLSIAVPGQLIPAFQLCYKLRSSGFRGVIIIGGNIISRIRNAIDDPDLYKLVDFFVFYQGEYSLLQIIKTLQSDSNDFSEIPNLAFLKKNKVIKTPLITKYDLESIQEPDFDGFPLGEYWGENYVTLVAARGCYYAKCPFCAIHLGWNENGYAGYRSTDLVFQDMVRIYSKYGFYRFKFIDEALIPKQMVELSQKIKESNLPFEWEGYNRLECFWNNEDFVKKVADGGFRKGYFGLEVYPSGNRKALTKNDTPDPEMLLKICNKYGIKVHFFTLFGFPGTGRPEAEATIEFMLNNAKLIDTLDVYRFGYMRGTKVEGIKPIIDPKKNWAMEFDWEPNREGVITKNEAEEIKTEMEAIMWNEYPRLLHPTYRLISPWR